MIFTRFLKMMSPFWRYSIVLRIGNRPFIGILKLYFYLQESIWRDCSLQKSHSTRWGAFWWRLRMLSSPERRVSNFSFLFLEENYITNDLWYTLIDFFFIPYFDNDNVTFYYDIYLIAPYVQYLCWYFNGLCPFQISLQYRTIKRKKNITSHFQCFRK